MYCNNQTVIKTINTGSGNSSGSGGINNTPGGNSMDLIGDNSNQYSPNYDDSVIYNQMDDNVYGPNTGLYKDLDLTFSVDPDTGDVNTLSDSECIKRSVLNIICLNKFDIPFNVRDFSTLKRLLFETDSHAVYASISTNLENLITVLEPRVRVKDINIEFNELDSSFTVDVKYTIIRTNTDDIVTKVIERVR